MAETGTGSVSLASKARPAGPKGAGGFAKRKEERGVR